MFEKSGIKSALRAEPEPSRRYRRAAENRAWALSPTRIIMTLASLPLVAGSVALSVYVRTSPYEPSRAVAHLVARAGCDAAASVGLAPAYRGGLGYHDRNDADGDGVACDSIDLGAEPLRDVAYSEPSAPRPSLRTSTQNATRQMVGGAKFIKP